MCSFRRVTQWSLKMTSCVGSAIEELTKQNAWWHTCKHILYAWSNSLLDERQGDGHMPTDSRSAIATQLQYLASGLKIDRSSWQIWFTQSLARKFNRRMVARCSMQKCNLFKNVEHGQKRPAEHMLIKSYRQWNSRARGAKELVKNILGIVIPWAWNAATPGFF